MAQKNCFHTKDMAELDYLQGLEIKASGWDCPLPPRTKGTHRAQVSNQASSSVFELDVSVYTDGDLFIDYHSGVRQHIFPQSQLLPVGEEFDENCPIESGSQDPADRHTLTVVELYYATQKFGGCFVGMKQKTQLNYKI